jgi:hypothetical protein
VAIVPIGKAQEARKQFFFEKKNQETCVLLLDAAATAGRIELSKSFLVLFFKKELLAS